MYATMLSALLLLAPPAEAPGADLVPFEENDKWGFKDAAGKIVVKPWYSQVGRFSEGLAPVNLCATSDSLFFPGMKTGGKWGYIDARGKLVVSMMLDQAAEFSEGLALVRDDRGVRFIDPSGKTAIDLGNVNAGEFHDGLAPVYEDRSLAKEDWQTKFIDKKGQKVFVVDGYAEDFREGMAVLIVARKDLDPKISNERKLYGYVDRTGKAIIPPRFAEAKEFHEGLAAVRTKKTTVYGMGDTWGYIDKSGKYVIEPQFNEAHPFQKGIARVHVGGKLQTWFDHPPNWEGGQWRLIDRKGKVLKQSEKWIEYEEVPADR